MNMTAILEGAVHKFAVNAALSEAATVTMKKSGYTEIIDESVIQAVLEQATDKEKTNVFEKLQNAIEAITKFIQTMISKVVEFFSPLEEYYKKNIKDFEQAVADFKIPDNFKISIVNYDKLNLLSANAIKTTMDELIEKAFYNIGLDDKSTVEEIKAKSEGEKQVAVINAISELVLASLKGINLTAEDNTRDKIKAKINNGISEEIQLTSIKHIETAVNLIPKYIGIKNKINEILAVTRRCRTSMISRLKSKPEGLRFFYGEYALFFSSVLTNLYNIISASCVRSAKSCRSVMKLVMESSGKKDNKKEDAKNKKEEKKAPKPGDEDVIDIE